jgi:hypothetical protein
MAHQSESARFQARFDSALQAYQKTTGIALVEHPVTVELQNCHSVKSIATRILYEGRAFSEGKGIDRIAKAIESTVSLLSALSASASSGDAISLVRQRALMASSTTLITFYSSSLLRKRYRLALPSYLPYVLFFRQWSQ